jgi:hypothetical protein
LEIVLFDQDHNKNWIFSNINLFFGYSKSGKTTILSDISSIFEGKNKSYIINGGKIQAGDFNVIFVPSNDSIVTHLKLNSKSLLRKILEDNNYSTTFKESESQLSNSLESISNEISSVVEKILPGVKAKINGLDNPIDLIMDSLSISIEDSSSSFGRQTLFSLVDALSRVSKNRTIIIVDDFNNAFDEESVMKFFEEASKSGAYFFLSSNRPIPQKLLTNEKNIFSIRNYGVTPVPPLDSLVIDSIVGQPQYVSFEDYMLGKGYTKGSGIERKYVERIREDERNDFLRILTSKNPVVSDEDIPGKVVIKPKSKEEEEVYQKLFSVIGIVNQ